MIEALPLLILALIPVNVPLWVTGLAILLTLPGLYALWNGPPFLPTPRKTVEAMLRLSDIKPGDRLYDLGCGDGRIVRVAAKRGADATGFELSLIPYTYAKIASLITRRGKIRFADFWRQDYRDADVVCCFLLKKVMPIFMEKIWPQLPMGCRVVSHRFALPGMEATKEEGKVMVYIKTKELVHRSAYGGLG